MINLLSLYAYKIFLVCGLHAAAFLATERDSVAHVVDVVVAVSALH